MNLTKNINPILTSFFWMLIFLFTPTEVDSQNRLRINRQLQQSVSPYSIIVTDASNNQSYTIPGTEGYVLSISSGIPTWVSAASGFTASNGITISGSDIQLGSASSGTGTHDFTADRFQYLAGFNYSIEGTAGTNIVNIDGNTGRIGFNNSPLTTSNYYFTASTTTGGDEGLTINYDYAPSVGSSAVSAGLLIDADIGISLAVESDIHALWASVGGVLINNTSTDVIVGEFLSELSLSTVGSVTGLKVRPTGAQSVANDVVVLGLDYFSTGTTSGDVYGIQLKDIDQGTITGTAYGIHQAGLTNVNNIEGNTIFGITSSIPDAQVHIYKSGTLGLVGFSNDTELILQNSTGVGEDIHIALIADAAGTAGLTFGDEADVNEATIRYHNSSQKMEFLTFAGAGQFDLLNTGQLNFNQYGSGVNSGTATYNLEVDASGNVIETVAGGGGGADGNYAENNLTADANRSHTWTTFNQTETFTTGDFKIANTGNANSFFIDGTTGYITAGAATSSYPFHIQQASTGGTAGVDADDLVIENTGDAGITVLSGSTVGDAASLVLGSSGNPDGLKFFINGTSTIASFGTTNAVSSLSFLSGNSVIAATVSSGQAWRFNDYGLGNNTGTAVYYLAVDASGNIIEETAAGATDNIYVINGSLTADRTMDMGGGLYDLLIGDIVGSGDEIALDLIQAGQIEMRYLKGVVNSEIGILGTGTPGDIYINLQDGAKDNNMTFTDTSWDHDMDDGITNSIAVSYSTVSPSAAWVLTDGTNTNTFTLNENRTEIGGQWATTGRISATLTASQNNWSPAGLSAASFIRIDGDAAYNITGINTASWTDGTRVTICNFDSADDFTFVHESASSTAANRFDLKTDANYILLDGSCIDIIYDQTSSRIRIIE